MTFNCAPTTAEQHTVYCALLLAADKYREDAKICDTAEPPQPRLAEQFIKQAAECDAIALRIELHGG